MNGFDYAILAVLVLSALFGLMRGFVAALISLVAWVAAFGAAWLGGDAVGGLYAPLVHNHTAQAVAGYLTCFIGVMIVAALLGWFVRRLLISSGLSGIDRLLGMLFGFARGLLIVIAVVLVLGFTPLPRQAWWQQSHLLPFFAQGADIMSQQVPGEVRHYLEIGGKGLPTFSQLPLTAPTKALSTISHLRLRAPTSLTDPMPAPATSVARHGH